jgi:hypothetical protein
MQFEFCFGGLGDEVERSRKRLVPELELLF